MKPLDEPKLTAAGAPRLVGADAVRAFACLWVCMTHLNIESPAAALHPYLTLFIRKGGYGVAMFFVLSGFLLSMPFLKAHKDGRPLPSLKIYAVRRLARIVPAYYLCVVLLMVLLGLIHTRWDFLCLGTLLTFTNSFYAAGSLPRWNGPLWSISVEMIFYLLLPLLMLGVWRLRTANGVRLAVVIVMAGLALAQWEFLRVAPDIEKYIGNPMWFKAESWMVMHNAPAMFVHFLVGLLAADACLCIRRWHGGTAETPGRSFTPNRFDLAALGAAALLISFVFEWIVPPQLPQLEYAWPTFPVLVGVLLVVMPFSRIVGPVLENRFIRLTATLSYGIYLWHYPIFDLIRHSLRILPSTLPKLAVLLAGGLGIIYAVAAISYVLVERPLIQWAHQFGRSSRVGKMSNGQPAVALQTET